MAVRLALEAMATRFELLLDGGEPRRLQAAGEQALERIREEEQRLSWFRRDSLVTLVNTRAAEEEIHVDAEFLELLDLCRAVHQETEGAFDPTVAPLLVLHGFREGPAPGRTPVTGFDQVELDSRRGTVRMPAGMQIDLGAVGKGWALELAAAELRACGVTSGLLHGGTSSIIGLGVQPYQSGWKIALRDRRGDPDGEDEPVIAAEVVLHDQALSVSAPHGRVIQKGEEEHGHVLDPRSGESVRGAAMAAAICDSAARADAWATALLVLGRTPDAAPLDWSLVLPPLPPEERALSAS